MKAPHAPILAALAAGCILAGGCAPDAPQPAPAAQVAAFAQLAEARARLQARMDSASAECAVDLGNALVDDMTLLMRFAMVDANAPGGQLPMDSMGGIPAPRTFAEQKNVVDSVRAVMDAVPSCR